jgi:hypothetical protein
MQKLDLDAADPAVKQFFLSLPSDPEGLELVLEGDVVCKIVGPHRLTGAELDAVLDAGWKQIRKTQERNKGVPAKVLQREVQEALTDVRRRNRDSA